VNRESMSVGVRERWLARVVPVMSPRVRLVCFPYAGSTAALFRGWPALLPMDVEVLAVQLPGRARRIREPPLRRVDEISAPVALTLGPELNRPFAIYGHSMGALLGFELARALAEIGARPPVRLFVSGFGGPSTAVPRRSVADMTDDEFLDYLADLNGTPSKVFDDSELMALMLPILRADFEMVAGYRYRPAPRLACPITAFIGHDDPEVSAEELGAWRVETDEDCKIVVLPGDHFFLHEHCALLLAHIAAELAGVPS
jgi:medium-chain acyl-[acyl-carrier-protein] hydrolase